jgi:fido (protein-threonine AMPylation protein)/biotin operon repressor
MSDEIGYMTSFDEYLRQGEPSKRESAANWQTAIGLQAVDGLQPSAYLLEVAGRNIEGEISLEESRRLIDSYYQSKAARTPKEEEEEEADKVSANIARILKSRTFAFNANGYTSLHRRIFDGVFKHAGKLRNYDITKRERVLDGDTVNYLNWEDLGRAVDYDIEQEKAFSYRGLGRDAIVEHIARFVSGLWQIHAFCEGNTRTTAVFTIQYLRSMGFDVDNRMFALHSWYFRNALVRANYRNVKKGIDYTPVYLVRFFQNLLYADQWDLKSRYLHIAPTAEWTRQPNLSAGPNEPVNAANEPVNVADEPVNVADEPVNAATVPTKARANTVNDSADARLSRRQKLIVELVAKNPDITRQELAEALSVSLSTLKRGIAALKDLGFLQRIGSDKSGRWTVLKS